MILFKAERYMISTWKLRLHRFLNLAEARDETRTIPELREDAQTRDASTQIGGGVRESNPPARASANAQRL